MTDSARVLAARGKSVPHTSLDFGCRCGHKVVEHDETAQGSGCQAVNTAGSLKCACLRTRGEIVEETREAHDSCEECDRPHIAGRPLCRHHTALKEGWRYCRMLDEPLDIAHDGVCMKCDKPGSAHPRYVEHRETKRRVDAGIVEVMSAVVASQAARACCVESCSFVGVTGKDGYCSKCAAALAGFRDDAIDNPAHYGGRDNPYEVHKVQVAWHGIEKMAVYFQLTAEVYLARAGKKDDDVADLRKAAWYANAAADAIEHGKYRP